jgi:hypothetical protein
MSHFCCTVCNKVKVSKESGWFSQYSDQATGWTTEVQFPAGTIMRFISLRHRVQTGSRAHPTSYTMGTGSSYPRGKADGAWSWPHLHLVPRLWRLRVIPPLSSLRFHGVVRSSTQGQLWTIYSSHCAFYVLPSFLQRRKRPCLSHPW